MYLVFFNLSIYLVECFHKKSKSTMFQRFLTKSGNHESGGNDYKIDVGRFGISLENLSFWQRKFSFGSI